MTESPKLPPGTLRVIIRNDAPFVHTRHRRAELMARDLPRAETLRRGFRCGDLVRWVTYRCDREYVQQGVIVSWQWSGYGRLGEDDIDDPWIVARVSIGPRASRYLAPDKLTLVRRPTAEGSES